MIRKGQQYTETITENKNYIVQLERYSKDMVQLDTTLNSYTYEPRTRDLFERKISLKSKMAQLKQNNTEILNAIKFETSVMENQILEQVHQILNLKSEFQEYQNSARGI
ncbi:MAG: hypothetical protein NWQ38_11015 [Cellulophaga sp.]|nr:hypothetical protein [Cellulophaga sp.]